MKRIACVFFASLATSPALAFDYYSGPPLSEGVNQSVILEEQSIQRERLYELEQKTEERLRRLEQESR